VSDPVPQRIGDAERDRAAEYLREHMSVGRLTQQEFDDRLTAALQARTAADLEPLFADLPAPKPGQERTSPGSTAWPVYQPPANRPVPTPSGSLMPMPSSRTANALTVASAIAWPAWILFCFAVSWEFWWLVFIPIIISSVAGQQKEELKRRERLWQKQQNPQLPPSENGPETP
jgi:Domain of unknown function (DUF1707)